MAEAENTEIVKGIYEAFGRGDIPAILSSLADDVEWMVAGREDGIPYAGTYRGRDGVGQFFTVLAENIEYSVFEALEFIAQGARVAVFGHYQGKVRPSGNSVETEWAMSWTLQDGKATNFRAYDDTAAVVAAFTMPSSAATAS
jgi:ketosteroid isomerase-like protein